ncbi:alkaline shock response membrane anchor protein AmaP [Rothia halotolerans]|uniref:alkaline shock response membrane anchor protein AmaP n=1 Tax=Rothia halotolerans TaxID=405770 RepID=UPI00101D2D7A|nr:alkaline shock response membrane anchor protein AmaP [Rothia halotolerans]
MRILAGGLNRAWLTVIGLVLLVLGVGWLLAASGLLASLHPALDQEAAPMRGASGVLDQPWMPAAMIVVAALLILAGLSWLVRQIPRKRQAPTLRFHEDARQGVTLMEAPVFSDAVAHDVEELEHVTAARALLRGSRSEPELVLRVAVNERADAQEVVDAISERILPRAVEALGVPFTDVGIEIVVTRQSRKSDRVRVQ